ncbi:MAG: Hsp20/alpha crystallin family protein [Cyclobacteriaceae bacterium]
MSIIRYNPLDFEPVSFSSMVDRFFNDALSRTDRNSFMPKADIIENDNSFEVHMAAPGLNKEDFNIELKDNMLTISGERRFSTEKKDRNYHAVETQYGSFSRSFTLPENVDASKINAKYNNGILELTIPKDEKKTLKTNIKVS